MKSPLAAPAAERGVRRREGETIPDITDLSLRARLGIALRLFAGFCERRGLDHPEVAAYLDYLWRFIALSGSAEAFGRWAEEEPPLVGSGLGWEYPPGFESFLAARGAAEGEFRRALCCTTEVLFGSLYGAAEESGSRRFVGELAGLVEPLGISFPDTRQFARSRWADGWGWGGDLSAEELAAWRCASAAEPSAAADRGRDDAFPRCEVSPRGPGG